MPRPKRKSATTEEQPVQRRRRTLTSDAQWCVDNQEQLTCKRFIEHHGLLKKSKAIQRYRNIIKKYLPDCSARLNDDLESWKQTADWSQFWMQKQRELAMLETHKTCLDYAKNVLHKETASITGQHSSNNAPDTDNDDITSNEQLLEDSINTSTVPKHDSAQLEHHSSSNCTPWMVAGVNLAEMFARYRQSAKERSQEHPLDIGRSLHDILSLTGILLLCPNQHSDQLIHHFGQNNLDKLTEVLISNTLDKDLDWDDTEFVKLSRIVNNMVKEIKLMDLDKRSKAIDIAELQLQQLAYDLPPFKKAIVKGIINMYAKKKCLSFLSIIFNFILILIGLASFRLTISKTRAALARMN